MLRCYSVLSIKFVEGDKVMTNQSNRWSEYRPSKSLWLWSCVGAAAATMIIGFGFGGWVTGGTAQQQAESATKTAVAELAATVCTQRVLASADAVGIYESLKKSRSWDRRKLLDEAGWTTFGEADSPIDGAASLCAEHILAVDIEALQAEATMAEVDVSATDEMEAAESADDVMVNGTSNAS